MGAEWKNEGEGSRSGAKAYDDATTKFAGSGRVKEAADKAKKAREGGERAELDRAEAVGRSHSKGEDSQRSKSAGTSAELKSALVNPADRYADPDDVVRDDSLTHQQKLKILRQWELDARQLSVAEEENMTGGEESMVGRVSRAILALGGEKEEGVTKLG